MSTMKETKKIKKDKLIENAELKVVEEQQEEQQEEEKIETKKEKSPYSKCSLFISTLPFNATEKDLETFFSDIGPIRFCFLIKKQGENVGCGIVRYALPQDADKALILLKNKKFMNLRTLKMEYAMKKSIVQERKLAGLPIISETETMQEKKKIRELRKVTKNSKETVENSVAVKLSPLDKILKKSVTIEIHELPSGLTKAVLRKKVRKFGVVQDIVFEDGQSFAKIVYAACTQAQKAQRGLHDHVYKGAQITCAIVETVTEAALAKKARVIIRNLGLSCKREHLLNVFESFGNVVDCVIPLVDGKQKRFGFVQFETVEEAAKAIETMNGKRILNRPIAVDWAIKKSQYEALKAVEEEEEEQEEDLNQDCAEDKKEQKIDQDFTEETLIEENDAIIVDAENSEPAEDPEKVDASDCTLFIRNLSFSTTRFDLRNLFQKWGSVRYAVITTDKVTGISRGTGFVCFELPEDAKNCLESFETFQAVSAPHLPERKLDDSKEAPKSVLTPSFPDAVGEIAGDFVLDGRLLTILPAVAKDIAQKISVAAKSSRRACDKRHLYLLREGVVFPGSDAAALLTPKELEHRTEQFANRKRLLATNPNLFISRTRLSIRGLPNTLTETEMRTAAKAAVKEFWTDVESKKREAMESAVIEEDLEEGLGCPCLKRRVFVKQAKIILEVDRLDPITKKPKSKGYGFIEFTSHADALACLRTLNNRMEAFPEHRTTHTKRLVVEFAVENRLVIKKREQKTKESLKKGDQKKKVEKKVEKKGEKKIEKRTEKKAKNGVEKMEEDKESTESKMGEKKKRKAEVALQSKMSKKPKEETAKNSVDISKETTTKRTVKKKSNDDSFIHLLSAYQKSNPTPTIAAGLVEDRKKWYE